MNIFLIALCSALMAGFFIYLAYQNFKTLAALKKQQEEIQKLAYKIDLFMDDTESSFGSVEREIEAAKNEILLVSNRKEVESMCDREKNTKKLFKTLSSAFSPSNPQNRDDD